MANKGFLRLQDKTQAAITTANANPTDANDREAARLMRTVHEVRENHRQNQRAAAFPEVYGS